MLNIYENFVKCLAENNIHCFLGIPSDGNVPTTYCLGFLAEKEVNGLMEELFETVSKDLWVRMDVKVDSSASSVFWSQGLCLQNDVHTKPILRLVHPGENIMAGEY